ncbi:MAG TPA: adenylate kinase [Candidatus Acidoferrum sp.]|nr:adenylate kinase [Candidatus Acidoferrum sp.]
MALDRPLVFFGPPAAGKGTQAKRIAELYSVPHLSTGDMLRDAIARGTEVGRAVKPILESGALVPDDIVMAMVEERLSRPDCSEGCVFDGFPRTVPQAQALDAILCRIGKQKPLVLELRVPRDTLIRRIAGRRTCSLGGEVYNVYDAPPRVDEICDRDGGKLVQRPDDRPDVFEQRLRAYERQTLPLEAFYRREGVLETVDGSVPMEDVTRALVSIVMRVQGRDGHL